MKIQFKNLYSLQDIVELPVKNSDLVVLNYHGLLCFNMATGIPIAVRELRRISLQIDCPIITHAKIDIEGDKYLSDIVIRHGEIVAVADCISVKNYTVGKTLRIYDADLYKIGLSVDADVLYSGSDNLFGFGADIVIHNSLDNFNRNYFRAYKSHEYLKCGVYFGLFNDCAVKINDGLKIINEEGEADISLSKCDRSIIKYMNKCSIEK